MGLSASLANAKDVGDWIGATAHSLVSFRPDVRPVVLELKLHGFDVNHFGSRMLAMAKPAYNYVALGCAGGCGLGDVGGLVLCVCCWCGLLAVGVGGWWKLLKSQNDVSVSMVCWSCSRGAVMVMVMVLVLVGLHVLVGATPVCSKILGYGSLLCSGSPGLPHVCSHVRTAFE